MKSSKPKAFQYLALVALLLTFVSMASAAEERVDTYGNIYSSDQGRVGIGNSKPTFKLDVNGSVRVHGGGFVMSSGTDPAWPFMKAYGNYNWGYNILFNPGAELVIGAGESAHQLTNDGDASGSSENLHLSADDSIFLWSGAQGGNQTRAVTINSTGNIGIGTTNPRAKLDVVGSVNLNGYRIETITNSTSWAGPAPELFTPLGRFSNNDPIRVVATDNGCGVTGGAEFYIVPGWDAGPEDIKVYSLGDTDEYPASEDDFIIYMERVNGNLFYLGIGNNSGCSDSSKSVVYTVMARDMETSITDPVKPNYTAMTTRKYVYSDDSGNVGIGTTNPGQRLHVNGTVRHGSDTNYMDWGADYFKKYVSGWTNGNTHFLLKRSYNTTYGDYVYIGTPGNQNPTFDQAMMLGDAIGLSVGRGHANGDQLSSTQFVVNRSGRVGIGTTSPDTALDVNGITRSKFSIISAGNPTEGGQLVLADGGQYELTGESANAWNIDVFNSRLRFHRSSSGEKMTITEGGSVGIGTTNPKSTLAVNGTITAKEIKVESGWSDFVFDDGYDLASLDEVESYIHENKHLPDIPSAKEVQEQGLAVSEMLAKQMQKIEEMTLYLIELNKENNLLKVTIANQDNQLAVLKELRARIEALEQRN